MFKTGRLRRLKGAESIRVYKRMRIYLCSAVWNDGLGGLIIVARDPWRVPRAWRSGNWEKGFLRKRGGWLIRRITTNPFDPSAVLTSTLR